MTPPGPAVGNLPRLTSLRFFAAVLILFFHARIIHIVPRGDLFDVAHMGVAFFFVLSGFVLTWASPDERVEPRRFWVNRFARIYPSHIVTMVIAIVILFPVQSKHVLLNILLLQAWAPTETTAVSLNGVAWSLSAEAFFYFLAPWLITALRRRSAPVIVSIALTWWVVTVVAGRGLIVMGYEEWPYFLPVLRSSEFIIGIVLAELFRRGYLHRRVPVSLSVLACAALYALSLVLYRHGVTMKMLPAIMTLPAICLLVVSAAQADVQGRRGLLALPLLEHAGKVSFALYLVHYLVIMVLEPQVPDNPGILTRLAYLSVVIVVSWVCAEVLHRGVEMPAQRVIRSVYAQRRLARTRPHRDS